MFSQASIFFALLATCLALPVYEQETTFSPSVFTSSESGRAERDALMEVSTEVSREERLADVLLESSSSAYATSEHHTREEMTPKDIFTNMDTNTEFSARAIKGFYSDDVTTEKSVMFMEREIQGDEPSTSVDSFGKLTGLLYDRSRDETTSAPVEEEKTTKKTAISIIPGKVTETKIYARLPSKSVITTEQPEDQPEELSQGEKQPILKAQKPNH